MKSIRLIVAALAMLIVCSTSIALGAQDGSESNDSSTVAALSEAPRETSGAELESKQTATSETFRLPDGSFETRIYESPVNYRDAEGDWKPIDEGLEPAPKTANGVLTNGDNSFDVSLPARMGAGPVRIEIGDEWVTSELLGQSSNPVQLERQAASYQTADPGVSFNFASLPNGLKEDIVISDPSQPSSFKFELQASDGVDPTLTEEGSIVFQRDSDKPVVVLPAPMMSDSAPGQPAISRDVHYELQPTDGGGWLLAVVPDHTWLEAKERIWPIRIDPTLHVPAPALDCTFGGQNPAESWGFCGSGGQKELYASFRPIGSGQWRRSLLRFDLSAIPSNAYVSGATLGVHAPSPAINTSGLEIKQATRTWTSGANWFKYNSSASWTTPGGDFSSAGSEILTAQRGSQAGWWNFSQSLAPLVQSWVSGATANQGVLLKLKDDKTPECGAVPCAERSLTLDSSAAAEVGKRPYMDVIYYPPVSSPESTVVSPTEGQLTARRLKLQATAQTGTTGLTFQFRALGSEGGPSFQTIPATWFATPTASRSPGHSRSRAARASRRSISMLPTRPRS